MHSISRNNPLIKVEIKIALKINIENIGIEVSEKVIQYQQIALKCVGSSYYKCFPVKRDVMFLAEPLYQYMYSFKNKVSDSVIFIQLTVVYINIYTHIYMCVCVCVTYVRSKGPRTGLWFLIF